MNDAEGLKHVVLLSLVPTSENNATEKKYVEIENELKETAKFKWTVLRTVYLQENLLDFKASIKDRKLTLPIKEGKIALLSAQDVVVATQKIIKEGEEHYEKNYDLIGPDLLDGKQLASTFATGLENEMGFESCDPKVFDESLAKLGKQEWERLSLLQCFESIAEGTHDKLKAGEHKLVENPVKFEDFVKKNAKKFKVVEEVTENTEITPLKIEKSSSPKGSPRKSPKDKPILSPREKQPGALSFRILKGREMKKGNYFVQVSLLSRKKIFKTDKHTEKSTTEPVWEDQKCSTNVENSKDEVISFHLFQKGIFNTEKGDFQIQVCDLRLGVPYRLNFLLDFFFFY